MRYYSNVAVRTTLDNSGGINNSATSIELDDTTGWPTQFPFTMRIDPNSTNEEIVTVNSGLGTSGTPYVVTRGADGTTAKSHAQGATVVHSVSARDLKEPQDHIASHIDHVRHYTDATARDADITSPTEGQLAYLNDVNLLTQYSEIASSWATLFSSYRKTKSADETISANNTTYQDDDHLTGIAYAASSNYRLRGLIIASSSINADFKMQLVFTAAPSSGYWNSVGVEGTGTESHRAAVISSGPIVPSMGGATAPNFFMIDGFFVSGSSGTFKLQWAKNSAEASNTTVYKGSFLGLEKF